MKTFPEDAEGTDTEIERELNRVEIGQNGEILCRWARRFSDSAGAEQVMWHRQVFHDPALVPIDVADWIADGKAALTIERNEAAAFLAGLRVARREPQEDV